MQSTPRIEWITLFLFPATYGVWIGAVFWLSTLSLPASTVLLAVIVAFHGSLQHEALHGHPTRWAWANTALAAVPLILVVPYLRFRDTHLAHHKDCRLTDPYDDPESNFLDEDDWKAMARPMRLLFDVNNTLAGRIILGPALGVWAMARLDVRSFRNDRRVFLGWAWHLPGCALLIWLIVLSPTPIWSYGLAVYGALALLRVRTFLEHRAHEHPRARSAIVEDRGFLSFLFLNNNLHAVHHAHPGVAWYKLPGIYSARKDRYLALNHGYRFDSYREIFRSYLIRRKDPVCHPIYRRRR